MLTYSNPICKTNRLSGWKPDVVVYFIALKSFPENNWSPIQICFKPTNMQRVKIFNNSLKAWYRLVFRNHRTFAGPKYYQWIWQNCNTKNIKLTLLTVYTYPCLSINGTQSSKFLIISESTRLRIIRTSTGRRGCLNRSARQKRNLKISVS